MRHINFLLSMSFLFFAVLHLAAQNCEPDEMYADSTAGVYPAPITPENPDGGIDEPACINKYYEYTLTVIIPDSITIDLFGQSLSLEIISADVPTEGAINGLPPGIDYLCVPGNCVMPALSYGCLLLYGTVPKGTTPGDYDLSLELNITFAGLGTQSFDFPGEVFPGEYYLTVQEENNPDCISSSIDQSRLEGIKLYPNPLTSGSLLQFSGNNHWKSATVFDANGLSVSRALKPFESVDLNVPSGLYTVVFDFGAFKQRKKLVVY